MSVNALLRCAAATALVAGLALCPGTVSRIAAFRIAEARVARENDMLRGLAADVARAEAARRAFESLPEARPPRLESLLPDILPAVRTEDIRYKSEAVGEGWIIRNADLTLRGVALADAMRFAGRAEGARPPWRLEGLSVRCRSQAQGTGDVTLNLRALSREGP